jgi:hypothetical protein
MKLKRRVLAGVAMLPVLASAAGAQGIERDAWVAPAGMIRVAAGMEYTHFDSRFGTDGTEPWAAPLLHPLDASSFAPLSALREGIDEFLTATGGGFPIPAASLSLGTPDAVVSADIRTVPFEVGLGLVPRVELGVMVPIFRSELEYTRFALGGGNVGRNRAPEENAAGFASLGPEFEELGRSSVLPLVSSSLGEELMKRVEAAGGSLVLPAAPLAGDSLLNAILASELGMPPLASHREPWRLGDAEANVRVRVLDTFGDSRFPADSTGLNYRLAAMAGVRLPTGSEPDTLRLLMPMPGVGLTGWSAGLAGDVFAGRFLWLGGTVRYSAARPVDVQRPLTPPREPFRWPEPESVRWSPPSELRIRLSPRVRLEDAVAVGLDYEMLRIGDSSFEMDGGANGALNIASGSVQRFGGSVRFTTRGRYVPGSGGIPLDATLSYARTLSGPTDQPVAAALRVEAAVYHRIWGR